jgi:tRNA A58 N-methylase Trm61
MLEVYTSTSSLQNIMKFFEDRRITLDAICPENNKSPWEQIEYTKDIYNKDTKIFTYSPYIMNMLNLLIRVHDLTKDDIAVYDILSGDLTLCDLAVPMPEDNNKFIIDTSDLSDPISWIYREYSRLNPRTDKI